MSIGHSMSLIVNINNMLTTKKFFISILLLFFSLPLFALAGNFLDGALLRAEGDIKVYLIDNSIKKWVSSVEVFNLNNFKWQDIKVVSKKEVTAIEEGEPIVSEIVLPPLSPKVTESMATPVPTVSITPVPPIPAKINDTLPPPDYIRADWVISNTTADYGRVGQKITFKYSDKEKDKIENFRLYEKKPGDRYFAKIAEFEEISSIGCEDIDINGEWMITEAGQCGYWAIQRIMPPGGRDAVAYLSTADHLVGEYVYYVAGVDKDGLETPASLQARAVFLNPVSILTPVDGQKIRSVYPNFQWTVASDLSDSKINWPSNSTIDYFIMISDNNSALSPIWSKQLKVLSGETEREFFYDGSGLDPTKKYKVSIYGHYRKSEYDPDYISIPFSTPEFWIKKPGLVSLFRNIFAAIFGLVSK